MIEELFQKVKNEEVRLDKHQSKLKGLLLSDPYFSEDKSFWDWRLSLASLACSVAILVFSFVLIGFNSAGSQASQDNFYAAISNNKNVTVVNGDGSTGNVLQMVDDSAKTVFYFDNRNVLVNSEVINNR